jgi:hypothetical protein
LLLGASLAGCARRSAAANAAAALAAESAWTDCVQPIQKQLKLSSEEGPAYTPAGVRALDNGKFTVNVYYPKTTTNYRCGIQQNADGTWQLLSLDSLDASNLVIWGLKR